MTDPIYDSDSEKGNFYDRLDRRIQLQKEKSLQSRPENLHDYQGCEKGNMTPEEIHEWLKLAISSLCGDRIHFSTSNKSADQHRRDAKQVQTWVDSKMREEQK